MGRLGSEGRRPLTSPPPLCRRHHLRFADDIVLITPEIEQVERMLAENDSACGWTGLRLNLAQTMFMKNGLLCVSRSRSQHDERPSSGARSFIMSTGTRGVGSFKNIEGVVKKTKNIRFRAHLFDTAVLPALTYGSETWALRKQDEHAISVTQRA
ncbi:hypothetical protein V3C99_001366, partial [Haemonchus contortus]